MDDENPRTRQPHRIPLQTCAACGAWCVVDVHRCPDCGASLRREEPVREEQKTEPGAREGEDAPAGRPATASAGGVAKAIQPRPPRHITMIIALAMFGILSSMAIPVLRSVMASGRMTAQANALVGSLRLARSVAIKSRSIVRICPAAPASAGRPACDASERAWERGWVVYADRNRNGVLDGDPGPCRATTAIGDCVVAVEPPLEGRNTLRGTAELAAGFAFLANGRTDQAGTFHLCDPARDSAPRTIAVRGTGRVEVVARRDSAATCG